jgi:hypothetical protein
LSVAHVSGMNGSEDLFVSDGAHKLAVDTANAIGK